jgi:hypothetical protein
MRKPVIEIQQLVGEQISTVAFVCDYVEFHFSGPILRSLSNPRVSVQGAEYRFPESGSRDALCRVIGSTVQALKLDENRVLELTTSNGCRITIPLDTENLRRGESEAMHFVPELNGPIQVW